MPELPEVETVARQLNKAVVGKRISSVRILTRKTVRGAHADLKPLIGKTIQKVDRRAKLIRMRCSGDWTLLVHLKMTGRMLVKKKGDVPGKHTRAVFGFTDKSQLFFDDMRIFGYLMLLPTKEADAHFAKEGYGPEPLDAGFDVGMLTACLARKKGSRVKAALLDQTCIAGIGNIYADEVLFAAGVRPTRLAGKVTAKERTLLHAAIQRILKHSISVGGSSSVDYVDTQGKKGRFVQHLKAYGHDGEPCAKKDGGVIRKTVVAGRGTHWCPVHQK